MPAGAVAAAPDFLLQIPEEGIAPGGGADELNSPRAVTGDPVNGHVYVSELANSRISEFTAWGQFVKAWGWDVAADGAPGDTASNELEVCTTVCQPGEPGDDPGQLGHPRGIALDGEGNLHIYEAEFDAGEVKPRVQKFDTDGNFLLMYGGEVNKTTGENVCTKADVEASEVCGAGVDGTGDGFFSGGGFGNYIAYNPLTDSVFVGDKDRVQEFDTGGNFVSDIDFEGALAAADGRSVGALAADPVTGELYFSLDFNPPTLEPIYKVSSSGALIDAEFASTAAAPYPGGLATDADGRLYVAIDSYTVNDGSPNSLGEVVAFEADGTPIAGMERDDEFATPPRVGGSRPAILGLGTNVLGPGSEEPGDLYVIYFDSGSAAYLNAYGPSPIAFEDPPLRPPVISAQYGVSAGTNETLVRAQINPRFWDDTTFLVEYGTEPCAVGGCEAQTPPVLLSAKSVNKALTTSSVLLDGLESGTTYHYRFVAESTGGGPVLGVDPDGAGPLEANEEDGLEGSFRTFAMPATAPDPCPENDDVRIGPAARLPDCRGYEMVSPLDKGGGDATLKGEELGSGADISQSAASGGAFSYSAKRAFGELESAPLISQYLADRDPDTGWASDPIAPQRTRLVLSLVSAAGNEFNHFSDDLCQVWFRQAFEPVLVEGAIAGYPNLYRRENCSGAPAYEALSRPEAPIVKPSNRPADEFRAKLLGVSADSSHGIFNSNGKLTAQGAILSEIDEPQLYEHVKGAGSVRLVCILPSGNPSPQPCAPGTEAGPGSSWSSVQGAISDDGQRIFWTSYLPGFYNFVDGEPGRIFVRVEGKTTKAVSQSVTAEDSWFWGAAEDGSKVIFEVVEGPLTDNLYEFDVDAAIAGDPTPQTLIAGQVEGMLGISENASRLYLASREDLDAGGPATAGEVNVYLREGGDFTFIGAIAAADRARNPNPIDRRPAFRGARLTPDGSHVTFVSSTPLTGYDNTDALTGQPDTEIFLYDALENELHCVSCNPSGIRPTGKSGVAAQIPAWERATYATRLLSEDGRRLFFESYEALVPPDTNAKLDVYQWEEAGKGTCQEGDPTFSEASGGCVELISSGQSATGSHFLDASATGEDVFIATLSSLVPQDYGLFDVYDARVNGGFPPPVEDPICEGQACQSPPPPPSFPPPPTAQAQAPESKSKPCPKGKRRVVRKGKARCVKPRKGKKQRKRSEKKGANR